MAFSEGDVGYPADRPGITLPNGTTIPMRSTLVFHRQNNAWKLIQQRNSVGVSNEQLIGMALPLEATLG